MQRLRDPNRERNAQCDVNNVSPNYWSHGSFLSLVFVFNGTLFWFQKLQRPRDHLALLRLGNFRDDAISELKKIAEMFELLC